MNWINNVVRPKLSSFLSRSDVPEKLWVKCPVSGAMVFHRDVAENMWVIPGSGYHMRIRARERLKWLLDDGVFRELKIPGSLADPLKFRDTRRYSDRLREARTKTGQNDSVLAVEGLLHGLPVSVCVQDFEFMGGTLGMAAGEAIIAAAENSLAGEKPLVLFAASGGARMQEGMYALMQMPRTTVAIRRLREAGIPYIVVLTNPTTGGVTASYAMLGDIHIAEPGALIGFAGPRVIEQTIREKLPEGFQRAEYLLAHGMLDMVVPRQKMRETLSQLCHLLLNREPVRPADTSGELPAPSGNR